MACGLGGGVPQPSLPAPGACEGWGPCAGSAMPVGCSDGAAGCATPAGTTAGSARRSGTAVTPLALQVNVKKHIQLILEQLLHTVNRRVIILDRENTLRVSTIAATSRCAGLRGCASSHSCLWATREMQKALLI